LVNHDLTVQLPGFAAKFNHHPAGYMGWQHLYDFSWFFVCTIASVIYYALCQIGDYAKEEGAMPFEALAAQQDEILNGVAPSHGSSSEGSEVNIAVELKV
jgi:hypothetical protein